LRRWASWHLETRSQKTEPDTRQHIRHRWTSECHRTRHGKPTSDALLVAVTPSVAMSPKDAIFTTGDPGNAIRQEV
jgi:hypothetical protein